MDMYQQLEQSYKQIDEIYELTRLYKESGLRNQAIRTISEVFLISLNIRTMEEQLAQHLYRLQTPDLTAALSIDSDDKLVLNFDIYRVNKRIMEWFNTYLSQTQRLALTKYMNIQTEGMA